MAELSPLEPETLNTTPTCVRFTPPLPLQHKNYQTSVGWKAMVGSEALGLPLVKSGNFAADMLQFEAHKSTTLHTHPGNHILFVVSGSGRLWYGGLEYVLSRGTCYFVPGAVPHRIKASGDGLWLLSVSDRHVVVDSPLRLEVVLG